MTVFILVSLNSFCSKNPFVSSGAYQKRVTITDYSNDSFYVSGKKYEIIFESDSMNLIAFTKKNLDFYTFLIFFKGEDDRPNNYEVVKLDFSNRNIFKCKIKIPLWASRFMFSVQDNKGNVLINWIGLPLVNQKGDLMKSAIRYLFEKDTLGRNYDNYVKYELEVNQNNLIFATKWFYELKYKILNKDILRKDIEIIKKSCKDQAERVVLLYIGYKLLDNQIEFSHYSDSLEEMKNITPLNNEFVCSFFDIFFPFDVSDSLPFNSFYEKLLFNNPNSLLFFRRLGDGSFRKLPFSKLINSINERINHNQTQNNYQEIISLYSLFLERKLMDSVRVFLPKIESYLNLLLRKNFLEKFKYFRNIYIQKALLLSYVSDGYILLRNYSKAIDILKNGIQLFDPLDFNNYFYYKKIAFSYEKIGSIDSALHYYFMALKLYPEDNSLKKEISKIVGLKFLDTLEYEKWLFSKLNNLQLYSNIIINPNLYLRTNKEEKIFLTDNKFKFIVLSFFHTSCGVCLKEIEFLNKHFENFTKKGGIVFLISPEDNLLIQEFLKEKNVKIPYITNSSEIMRYFNINLYPTTVIIGSNGRILNLFYGFDPNNEKHILNLIN
jgi:peroxiredoxin